MNFGDKKMSFTPILSEGVKEEDTKWEIGIGWSTA